MSREKLCGVEGLVEDDWRFCEFERERRRCGEITAASVFFFDDLHISGDASAAVLRCAGDCYVSRVSNLCMYHVCACLYFI